MNIARSLQVFQKVLKEDRQFRALGCPPGWFVRLHYHGRLNDRLGRPQPWSEVDLNVAGRNLHLSLAPPYLEGLAGIFIEREYDCAALLGFAPKTILDLGANIGFASLYLSTLFPQASIATVEPDPRNVHPLKRNLQFNGVNATTFEAAAGSGEGTLQLRFGDDPMCSSLETNDMHVHPSATSVAVTTVPAILAKLGWSQIDLLKVDIEGGEDDLFSKNADWLSKVRAIIMEIHPNTTPERIGGYLAPYGFKVNRFGSGREPVYIATRQN